MARRTRALLVVLLAGFLAASGALLSPASAHAKLDSSDPKNGAALQAAPTQVSLTFDEPVTDPVLTASDDVGTVVALGAPTISGSTITASWPGGTGGGLFRVEWQVKSDDGDTVDGVILFSVAGPKATESAAVSTPGGGASTTSSSGLPGWLWPLLLVLLVVMGIVALVARRSGTHVPSAPDTAPGDVDPTSSVPPSSAGGDPADSPGDAGEPGVDAQH